MLVCEPICVACRQLRSEPFVPLFFLKSPCLRHRLLIFACLSLVSSGVSRLRASTVASLSLRCLSSSPPVLRGCVPPPSLPYFYVVCPSSSPVPPPSPPYFYVGCPSSSPVLRASAIASLFLRCAPSSPPVLRGCAAPPASFSRAFFSFRCATGARCAPTVRAAGPLQARSTGAPHREIDLSFPFFTRETNFFTTHTHTDRHGLL